MTVVSCRAKVSSDCYDGRDSSVYSEDNPITNDGTWDGKSVICDACYLLTSAFENRNTSPDEAVQIYLENLRFVKDAVNLEPLIAQAKNAAEKAHPGSPSQRSALVSLKMAQDEYKERQKKAGVSEA